MADVNPTIEWVQYTMGEASNTVEEIELANNTVTYDAVQAGYYSNAICVQPRFSSNADNIGSVRIWWSDYEGTVSGNTTEQPLPATGWVLKYYVTDCTNRVKGEELASTTVTANLYGMLKFLTNNSKVQKVTRCASTISSTELDSYFDANQCWCSSTWQGDSDNFLPFQPLPFDGYLNTVGAYADSFAQKYATESWKTIVFGDTTSDLKWAIGGDLYTYNKCNVVKYVNGKNSQQFPYIFFSIQPPSAASAGTWSGWACRISYIWPYSIPTTETTI